MFKNPARRVAGLVVIGFLFIAFITIALRSTFGLTAGPGPAFVQGAAQTANGTSLSTTYSNNVTAGDLLVAVFRTPGGTAVSDQLNGAWTQATGNNLYTIWYLPNAKAGRTSVTVTATSGALRAAIAEYSGMATSSVFDSGSCNSGSGTVMSTGNTASIGTGELVFAGGGTTDTPITVSAGSSNGVTATVRNQATGAVGTIADEDFTQAAPGVQNASMTLSAAVTNGWNACVATFRSVLSPVPTPTLPPTPTPAPTFPPLSGGLLPGQQIWNNGVSSYLFGTNDTEEWLQNNVETNSTVQGYLKSGGLPLMRSFFFHNSLNGGHENTDADIQRRINAITNSGMNCLGVIPSILLQSAPAPGNTYTDLGWAKHLVSLLDGTHPGYQECDMYEIGNEPDLTPDASNYVTEWNTFVPALRAINPRAKFFGPASYTINYSYIQWFLQGTVASGVQPDGVTFHRYGCSGTDTNLCLQMAALYGDRVNKVRTIVVNTLHKNIPIGITEWNMDPGSNNVLAGNHQFMQDFTTTSLNSMIAAHLDFANQFDAMSFAGYGTLDMFSVNTSQPKAQFWAMVGVLQQNGGPSTLPLPTLTPTPTPVTPTPVTPTPVTPTPSPTPGGATWPVYKQWFFGEGRVGAGFTEWLTLGNPTSNPCQVDIQYQYTSDSGVSGSKPLVVSVPANTRVTQSVNHDLGISATGAGNSVSTTVSVDSTATPQCTGIVAERPIYNTTFGNPLGVNSGTDVIGATHTGTNFYFADVRTGAQAGGGSVSSFIPILNSGTKSATVTATYYVGGTKVGSQPLVVPAGTRGTIYPGRATPGLPARVAAWVTSDQPVLVERPSYFNQVVAGNAGTVSGDADVVGVQQPAPDFLFAEGYTGGQFQEYLVLANFDPATDITNGILLLEYANGATFSFPVKIAHQDQTTIDINHLTTNPTSGGGTCLTTPKCVTTQDVSIEVKTSGSPFVAERELFFRYNHNANGRSLSATGVSDVTGQVGPAAATAYSFAEGYTNAGYDEWLTLQNPTASPETVTVNLANADGRTYSFLVTVGANTRATVDITAMVIQHLIVPGDTFKGYEVSMSLSSSGAFVAERPMYFNASGYQGGDDQIGYTGG